MRKSDGVLCLPLVLSRLGIVMRNEEWHEQDPRNEIAEGDTIIHFFN